jgi:heat shock protein HtpX
MNYMKTFGLLAGLTALFMGIGFLLGGTGGAMIALVMACMMNGMAFWFSDSIVLKMSKASVADEKEYRAFYDIVRQQIMVANLPMPKLYVMDENIPNAFATGRNPQNSAVAITTGIWHLLSKEELSGVIAHELAHIKNRDTLISTIAATFAGAISMLANMFMFMNLFGGNSENRPHPVVGILLMIVAPLAASIIQMAISRQREYAADKLGGQICGNPLYLASALSKLESYSKGLRQTNINPNTAHMYIINPFAGKGDNLFSTHPNTNNRINALKQQAENMGYFNYVPKKEDHNINNNIQNNSRVNKGTYDDANTPNNPWL